MAASGNVGVIHADTQPAVARGSHTLTCLPDRNCVGNNAQIVLVGGTAHRRAAQPAASGQATANSTGGAVPAVTREERTAEVCVKALPDGQWRCIKTAPGPSSGLAPAPRVSHAAVAIGDALVIHGGLGADSKALDDMFVLHLSRQGDFGFWKRVSPAQQGQQPSARHGHAMAFVGNRYIVMHGGHGGLGGVGTLQDTWVLDVGDGGCAIGIGALDSSACCWQRLPEDGAPTVARSFAASTADGGSLYICGGIDGDGNALSDAHRLSACNSTPGTHSGAAASWRWVRLPDLIGPRVQAAAAVLNGAVHVTGGWASKAPPALPAANDSVLVLRDGMWHSTAVRVEEGGLHALCCARHAVAVHNDILYTHGGMCIVPERSGNSSPATSRSARPDLGLAHSVQFAGAYTLLGDTHACTVEGAVLRCCAVPQDRPHPFAARTNTLPLSCVHPPHEGPPVSPSGARQPTGGSQGGPPIAPFACPPPGSTALSAAERYPPATYPAFPCSSIGPGAPGQSPHALRLPPQEQRPRAVDSLQLRTAERSEPVVSPFQEIPADAPQDTEVLESAALPMPAGAAAAGAAQASDARTAARVAPTPAAASTPEASPDRSGNPSLPQCIADSVYLDGAGITGSAIWEPMTAAVARSDTVADPSVADGAGVVRAPGNLRVDTRSQTPVVSAPRRSMRAAANPHSCTTPGTHSPGACASDSASHRRTRTFGWQAVAGNSPQHGAAEGHAAGTGVWMQSHGFSGPALSGFGGNPGGARANGNDAEPAEAGRSRMKGGRATGSAYERVQLPLTGTVVTEAQVKAVERQIASLPSIRVSGALYVLKNAASHRNSSAGSLGTRHCGAKSVVGFATCTRKKTPVALKFCISNEAFTREQELYRCERLAPLLPGLLGVHDSGMLRDGSGWELPPFIAMERGETLSSWMERTTPDILTLQPVLAKVAKCLGNMHTAGFVHGSIKPGHILWFSKDERCALCDLSCTTPIGNEAPLDFTLVYAAPEQVEAWHRARKTFKASVEQDAWALGVVIFEVLTGRKPFDLFGLGDRAVSQQLRGEGSEPLPWEALSKDDEGKLGKFQRPLLQLLQRDPAKRLSMEKFYDACNTELAASTVVVPPVLYRMSESSGGSLGTGAVPGDSTGMHDGSSDKLSKRVFGKNKITNLFSRGGGR